MPSDLVLKTMNFVHRATLTLSFGKLGWSAGGMPVLELTTIGRKTGELRSQANPEVQVALGGKPKQPYHARVATAEERAEMWPAITGKYKTYGGYQERTEREIPLVLLEPA
jgi:hypothetical protein